jgi:hypothetical protein
MLQHPGRPDRITGMQPSNPRQFSGLTDDGRRFVILYTNRGVRWLVGAEADAIQLPTQPSPPRVNTPARVQPINTALEGAAGLIGPIAHLVASLCRVLEWWEARETRLLDEARFEEERRIPWTYDMMGRWVRAHRDAGHVDLDISHYLGRETAATLVALSQNKKMAVPQAMLYELEQIRTTISSARVLLVRQFSALEHAQDFNISAIVASAYGRQSSQTFAVNFEAIRRWGSDPGLDWERCLVKGELKSFEAEFREMHRFPQKLIETALGYKGNGATESTAATSVADASSPFWAAIAAAGLKHINPLIPLAVAVGPAAVSAAFETIKDGDTLRRDDFKELALITAEVERVRLLHRLWCILDGAVRHARGGGLLVQEEGGTLALAAPEREGPYKWIAEAHALAQ